MEKNPSLLVTVRRSSPLASFFMSNRGAGNDGAARIRDRTGKGTVYILCLQAVTKQQQRLRPIDTRYGPTLTSETWKPNSYP